LYFYGRPNKQEVDLENYKPEWLRIRRNKDRRRRRCLARLAKLHCTLRV